MTRFIQILLFTGLLFGTGSSEARAFQSHSRQVLTLADAKKHLQDGVQFVFNVPNESEAVCGCCWNTNPNESGRYFQGKGRNAESMRCCSMVISKVDDKYGLMKEEEENELSKRVFDVPTATTPTPGPGFHYGTDKLPPKKFQGLSRAMFKRRT